VRTAYQNPQPRLGLRFFSAAWSPLTCLLVASIWRGADGSCGLLALGLGANRHFILWENGRKVRLLLGGLGLGDGLDLRYCLVALDGVYG
jgi:hypothetical protein